MKLEFTAIIEKRGKWYIGYLEELPGVNTQGHTLREVRENLKEALQLIIQANRELAEKAPGPEKVLREKMVLEV
jgi:predicted RNase H-like HicB family nuclease